MGIRCADHATPSVRKKMALTLSTSGDRSVGIVRSWIQATEFFKLYFCAFCSAMPGNIRSSTLMTLYNVFSLAVFNTKLYMCV
jgi:hypothetical protein